MGQNTDLITQQETHPILIRKANNLIVSKYKSSLLENILVSIGLSRMYIATDGNVVANIYPREISKIMGKDEDDCNIYTRLKNVSRSITGHNMLVEDGKGNFVAFNLVKTASYINGTFTITFHEAAKPYIMNLKTNFTTMNLLTLSSFHSNASFRLYEILLKEAYKIPPEPGAFVEKTYNISELRFMLSVANIEEEKIQRELNKYQKAEEIDWDKLYGMALEKKHPKWNNFRDHVIEKAKNELDEKADLRFEYECIRHGREGYKSIKFRIFSNTPVHPVEDYTLKEKILLNQEGHQYDLEEINHPELFEKYLGHNGLTSKDLKILLTHAAENEQLVMQAIEMADKQETIYNYVGWLISCIERNFDGPTKVMKGSAEFAKKYEDEQKGWEEMMDEMHQEIAKPGFKELMWKSIQENEDFSEFLASMHLKDASQLLHIFTPEKCVDVYFEYKLGHFKK